MRICERCETPHHADCWDYAGGCALFGCRPGERSLVAEESASLVSSLEGWMRYYRIYASCLVGASVSMMAYVFSLILALSANELAYLWGLPPVDGLVALLHVFSYFWLFGLVLCGLGMVVFLLPAIVAHYRVNSILECDLSAAGCLSRPVLDRLELSGLSGFILYVFGPRRYLLTFFMYCGIAALILSSVGMTMSGFMFGEVVLAICLCAIVLGFFFALPMRAACDRLAFLSSVQNRALVTFKGAKSREL